VLVPGGTESWTLLGDDGEVVEPAERYLAYLAAVERSPNTVRAYAISLKLWFEFLQHAAVSWDEAGVEDVARFVAWLRPGGQRDRAGGRDRGPGPCDGQPVSGGGLRLL
jgi:integrase/recombinase XerD